MNELQKRYFDWMYNRVMGSRLAYRKLLLRLNERKFTWLLQMDENRKEDGLDLRYRFGHENGIPDQDIVNLLDISDCSVLEMMTALAIHCEEDIMDDPEYGDRTGKWFWGMIKNMELASMDDAHYDQAYVDERIDILLRRRYSSDGRGGLFHLKHCTEDLRNVQIWYQMNWYLNEIMDI